jgi:intron-binding protein aquarius
MAWHVQGDIGYTCETAGYFYLYNVLARWEAFLNKVAVKGGAAGDVQAIAREFPFAKYFENAPQPLFKVLSHPMLFNRRL